MSKLIEIENNNIQKEVEKEIIEYDKTLKISALTSDVDYKGIINNFLQYIDIATVLKDIKIGTEYVVQIPVKFQGGLRSGKYWIMENTKTGKRWPTLMECGKDGKNKIVTPLAIKKKEFLRDNPVRDIENNYQNLYLQQQMHELSALIEDTLQTVQRIENGQLDDRIGLLESGRQGVILALSQKDEATRTTSLMLATNNINVAQNQIFENLKRKISDFKPLPKTNLGQFLKEMISTGYLDKKDDEYDAIQEYYNLYLEATRMLAGVYIITGDKETPERVFNMSIQKFKGIDYTNLKTIEYSHKNANFEKIYEDATVFLETEKQLSLAEDSACECLEISINGEELLEVAKNV